MTVGAEWLHTHAQIDLSGKQDVVYEVKSIFIYSKHRFVCVCVCAHNPRPKTHPHTHTHTGIDAHTVWSGVFSCSLMVFD